MAGITFNKNYIILKADAAVATIDLGFADANALKNNQATPKALTGSSEKSVVHYKGEDPPPRTFRVAKEATFPEDAHVTITGGGEHENTLEAVDGVGNKAHWTVVGGS